MRSNHKQAGDKCSSHTQTGVTGVAITHIGTHITITTTKLPQHVHSTGGNVTSAGWQVTLCDPILHVSSCSSEACCELLYSIFIN